VLQAEAFARLGQGTFDRLAALGMPVIAAVNGFALGGGCELAMACDLVIAGPTARFGQPEVALGLIPGFGGTQRLVRRAGLARALDWCLTGRMVDVDEALAAGIVSRKVDGSVLDAAVAIAADIASKGPVAVRLCKRALHENADGALAAGLAAERSLFAACFATADHGEGMDAFLERPRRAANFTGR
jgi:enoyl-CoA hydratase